MVSNEFLTLSVTNTLYYYRLQQTYTKSVKQLGETGFGLITNGREAEIKEGSTIFNVWRMSTYSFLTILCSNTVTQRKFKNLFRGSFACMTSLVLALSLIVRVLSIA